MFINEEKAWEIVNSNLPDYEKIEKLYEILKPDIEYMLSHGVSLVAAFYTIFRYFGLDIKLLDFLTPTQTYVQQNHHSSKAN